MRAGPLVMEELLRAARGGSSAALWELLAAGQETLLRLATRAFDSRLRAKAMPADVVLDTLLEARLDFRRFRGTTVAEWEAWLRQVLRHNLTNFRRSFRSTAKRQVSREISLESVRGGEGGVRAEKAHATPEERLARQEARQRVDLHLSRLPRVYRQVIVLRVYKEMSFEEIAAVLGRSAEAARHLWSRGVKKLLMELRTGSGE